MIDRDAVAFALRETFRTEPEAALIDRFSNEFSTLADAIAAMIDEAVETVRATRFYQVYFNRLPDPGGLDFWTSVIKGDPGLGDTDRGNLRLSNAFFEAGEFAVLYGDLAPAEAVEALYRNLLGREPDQRGLDFWTALVLEEGNGFGLRELARAFVVAPETDLVYPELIERYLGDLATDSVVPDGSTIFRYRTDAVEDAYAVDADTVLSVDAATGVLANDVAEAGESLSAAVVSEPENGAVTLAADGSFVYTPDPGFTGEDRFTYSITAPDGTTREATVTLTVTAPDAGGNARPEAEDISLAITVEAGPVQPSFPIQLLGSDSDPGDALLYSLDGGLMDETGAGFGALSLNAATGNLVFLPGAEVSTLTPGETRVLTVGYSVSDDSGAENAESEPATLTITLTRFDPAAPASAPETSVVPEGADGRFVVIVVPQDVPAGGSARIALNNLPDGAALTTPDGQPVTGELQSAGEPVTIIVTGPPSLSGSEIGVVATNVSPSGVSGQPLETALPLVFNPIPTVETLTVTATDQNIWASGDALQVPFSAYFPLVGGDRSTAMLESASVEGGFGSVDIVDNALVWQPGDAFAGLEQGDVVEVDFAFSYCLDGGALIEDSRTVAVEQGAFDPVYLDLAVSERGGVLRVDVLSGVDVLNDPYTSGLLEIASVSIDSDAAFAGLRAPVEEAREPAAQNREDVLADYLAEIEVQTRLSREAQLVNAVLAQEATVAIARGLADAALVAFNAGSELAEVTRTEIANLEAELAGLEADFNAASAELQRLTDAAATTADPIERIALEAASLVQQVVTDATRLAFELARDTVAAADQFVDAGETALQQALIQTTNTYNAGEINLAFFRQQLWGDPEIGAEYGGAVSSTPPGQVIPKITLIPEVGGGGRFFEGTETSNFEYARAFLDDPNDPTGRTQIVYTGRAPTGDDLVSANADATAQDAIVATRLAALAAADAELAIVDAALAAIDGAVSSFGFQAFLDAFAEMTAQAGVQLDVLLEGGSVDAFLDYDLTTELTYDEGADRLTIETDLSNANGEDVVFTTISPNARISAELLFDVSASIEAFFDATARLGEETLFDASGDEEGVTILAEPTFRGSVPFFDFDTRDGQDGRVSIPGLGAASRGILDVSVALPTIETEGTAATPDTAFYTEGGLVGLNLEELTSSFFNLVNAGVDFSEEFRDAADALAVTLPDELGSPEDVAQLVFQTLGAIFAVAFGGGEFDQNGDGVVPIFIVDGTDETASTLLQANIIPDNLKGLEDGFGDLGFYTAFGESNQIVRVEIDIDQLVAVIINSVVGNTSNVVLNPYDIQIGIDTIFDLANIPPDSAVAQNIQRFVDLNLSFEKGDLDVGYGASFSQEFGLILDDMLLEFTFEDGTVLNTTHSEGGTVTLEGVSARDTNGDGRIDYDVALVPVAQFSNDTELGVSLDFQLDFVKAALSAGVTLDLAELFPDVELFGQDSFLGEVGLPLIDGTLGPILRVAGDLDAFSIDLFEDRFRFDFDAVETEGSADLSAFLL